MLATPGLERIPVLVRKCPARAGAASRPVSGGSQGSPLPAGGRLPAPQVCPNACASENKADGAHEDHGHGGEKRGGPSIGFPPQQPGVRQSQRRSFTPLYVGSFQCLSISIHTFLGFVLGEPDIFLKKGGEPLTVWTVLLPRGFAPNSCVRPLRHHSGPLSVSSSRSSSHHCGSLGDVMCTLFSQTGHPASTPPRRTG